MQQREDRCQGINIRNKNIKFPVEGNQSSLHDTIQYIQAKTRHMSNENLLVRKASEKSNVNSPKNDNQKLYQSIQLATTELAKKQKNKKKQQKMEMREDTSSNIFHSQNSQEFDTNIDLKFYKNTSIDFGALQNFKQNQENKVEQKNLDNQNSNFCSKVNGSGNIFSSENFLKNKEKKFNSLKELRQNLCNKNQTNTPDLEKSVNYFTQYVNNADNKQGDKQLKIQQKNQEQQLQQQQKQVSLTPEATSRRFEFNEDLNSYNDNIQLNSFCNTENSYIIGYESQYNQTIQKRNARKPLSVIISYKDLEKRQQNRSKSQNTKKFLTENDVIENELSNLLFPNSPEKSQILQQTNSPGLKQKYFCCEDYVAGPTGELHQKYNASKTEQTKESEEEIQSQQELFFQNQFISEKLLSINNSQDEEQTQGNLFAKQQYNPAAETCSPFRNKKGRKLIQSNEDLSKFHSTVNLDSNQEVHDKQKKKQYNAQKVSQYKIQFQPFHKPQIEKYTKILCSRLQQQMNFRGSVGGRKEGIYKMVTNENQVKSQKLLPINRQYNNKVLM